MDIYWKNKVKIIFFTALLSLSFSCKTVDIKESKKSDRVVVKREPYKMSTLATIEFDNKGSVKPLRLDLNIGKTKSKVFIKGDKVEYLLESKDTIITKDKTTVIESVTKIEKPKELTWWGKIKKKVNTFAIYILIANVLFVAYKVTSFIRKVSLLP